MLSFCPGTEEALPAYAFQDHRGALSGPAIMEPPQLNNGGVLQIPRLSPSPSSMPTGPTKSRSQHSITYGLESFPGINHLTVMQKV